MNVRSALPSGPAGSSLEELAWSLIELTSADQMIVYRASETGSAFDPAVALGSLSLQEKQAFWASQFDPAADPLAASLAGPVSIIRIDSEADRTAFGGSIIERLRSRSLAAFRLVNRGQLLGLALLGWLAANEPMPEARLMAAAVAARSMALEIDNERLYESSHQLNQQALIGQEITQAILRKDDLKSILTFIASEGLRAVDALGCGIWLLDDGGKAEPAVQVGMPFSTLPDAQPVLRVLETREPFFLSSSAEDDEQERTLSTILPLLSEQEAIGFLAIQQVEAYSQPGDLAAARAFASQAAVAVELARLYERLRQTTVAEERARLARDLHDSVSQSLYAMTLYTRAAQKKLSEGSLGAVENYLRELNSTSREALGEMRLMIFELRPLALERYGLKGILEQRLQSVEARSGLETSLEIDLHHPLPAVMEENLYHIALEALNNTIKHAQASRVWVSIQQTAGSIRLVVQDDGTGLPEGGGESGGVGLKSIQERAAVMNGRLEIASQPGEGMTISVEVPYDEHSNPDR